MLRGVDGGCPVVRSVCSVVRGHREWRRRSRACRGERGWNAFECHVAYTRVWVCELEEVTTGRAVL